MRLDVVHRKQQPSSHCFEITGYSWVILHICKYAILMVMIIFNWNSTVVVWLYLLYSWGFIYFPVVQNQVEEGHLVSGQNTTCKVPLCVLKLYWFHCNMHKEQCHWHAYCPICMHKWRECWQGHLLSSPSSCAHLSAVLIISSICFLFITCGISRLDCRI